MAPEGDSIKKKKGDNPYVSGAHTIARCVDLWCEVDKVIKIVRLLQQDEASKLGELDEDDIAREVREACLQKISPESREDANRTYYKIIHLIPGFKELVDDPTKSAELASICNKMNSDIKSTRSSDASHLKTQIPSYCLPNPHDPTSLHPPIAVGADRAELGLNHPILARWLCPLDQLKVFDENPEQARKALASGEIPMESYDFPALFWSGTMPGQDGDPDDPLPGLFRSYFLVRVARHIFLGPSFAIAHPEKKNRSCNAILNDVTTIEPEHIAYVCIHARFGITSKRQWNEVDGDVNYSEMYRSIIRFIRHADDLKWREGLLQWWNKEIFGNENGRGSSAREKKMAKKDGNSAPRMTTMEKLRAQMKARAAIPSEPSVFEPTSDSSIDPSLRSGCGTSKQGPSAESAPSATPRSTSGSITAAAPAVPLPAYYPSAISRASTATPVPVTPRPPPATAAAESPLSETESLPLTPVTNRRGRQGKSAKANGKRPAPPDEEVDSTAVGGRTGRKSKRSRK
ncbi:hypothetical protein L210DRAFT_3647883 [Boletus edulis BED1]|uniref:Uncharacterized protein n=1 Tax=Boletus edulis BED1 TaxID=1328754 RepID=A0AAD4BPI5_BOLED|nr:hypothetical protein L210DRAFT_988337 [Boletus edulis BED1]KAF8436568.1 hypothetical protein L210DRAFT_3647883 [Boletus edulis BED1]